MLHTTKFVSKFIALIRKVNNYTINHEKNEEYFNITGTFNYYFI